MINNQELELIKQNIIDLTNQNFVETQKGLLLSRVGERLTPLCPSFRKILANRKLAEFIQEELSDSVQILTSPENSIVKVVLPKFLDVTGKEKDFLPAKKTKSNREFNMFRYSPSFWAAFSYPIEAGKIRKIELNPISFSDISAAELPLNPNDLFIPPNLIVDEHLEKNTDLREKKIIENITSWLNTNKVDKELVSAKRDKHHDALKSELGQTDTILELLIKCLTIAELKRVELPLDIIAKLNTRL